MKNTMLILAGAAIMAGSAYAQGPKGPALGAPGTGQPQVNVAAAETVTGKLTAVQVAYGTQYPSITLNGLTIKIAPVWYLLDNDFELAAGDEVKVLAAPTIRQGDPSLYAISILKVASGVSLALRSETGTPLWTAPGPGNNASGPGTPRRQGDGSGCIDPATIAQATGVVDAITQGAGIQQPQITLVVSGKSITVKIGPERILLASDMEIKTGMTLTVKYATASCTGELVALSITDQAGNTVTLRNEAGAPGWN